MTSDDDLRFRPGRARGTRPAWPDCTPIAGGVTIGVRSPIASSTATSVGYQLARWTERLSTSDPQARTIVAELGGEVVGLAHTQLGENADWGALLDNLHVSHGRKRLGIGTRLLALTAQAVLDSSPGSGLYLWVLQQNTAAQAFYAARGGTCVETGVVSPPGDPARLHGSPTCLRFAWPDPSRLLPTAG